jgi:hypothetical protein
MTDSFSIEINDLTTRMCDSTLVGDKIQLTSMGQKETSPLFYSSNTDVTIEKQANVIAKLQNELKITKKNVNTKDKLLMNGHLEKKTPILKK